MPGNTNVPHITSRKNSVQINVQFNSQLLIAHVLIDASKLIKTNADITDFGYL
jgi:hypothetical protein